MLRSSVFATAVMTLSLVVFASPASAQVRRAPPARAARAAGGNVTRTAGGNVARTNIHQTNVNENRNVNVNVNRNVDVHGGYYGGAHYDSWGHPIATAAAVTTAAVVVGTMVASLPPHCSGVSIGGVAYQQCGSSWYQPVYQGTSVQYVVVDPPR
jgi:hypothetical protein